MKTVENLAVSEVPIWAIRITWFHILWMDEIIVCITIDVELPFLWDVLPLIESENAKPGKGWYIGRDAKFFSNRTPTGITDSCTHACMNACTQHIFLECPCKETNINIRKPPNFLKRIKSRSSLMWRNVNVSLSFGNCSLTFVATVILTSGFSYRLSDTMNTLESTNINYIRPLLSRSLYFWGR